MLSRQFSSLTGSGEHWAPKLAQGAWYYVNQKIF